MHHPREAASPHEDVAAPVPGRLDPHCHVRRDLPELSHMTAPGATLPSAPMGNAFCKECVSTVRPVVYPMNAQAHREGGHFVYELFMPSMGRMLHNGVSFSYVALKL